MHLLVSAEEFENSKSREMIPLECAHCKGVFHKAKNHIQATLTGKRSHRFNHCSPRCQSIGKGELIECKCGQCGVSFEKHLSQMRKTKNHFCSNRCAGKYSATHKTTGTRRSKLECWIEQRLSERYTHLIVSYNKTQEIEAELDIYIPSLKLAFELNGIFHYEPIFGLEKLDKIKQRDQSKFAICRERGIGLCVIDTSHIKYHKPKTAQPILDIITRIIDDAMGETVAISAGLEPAT